MSNIKCFTLQILNGAVTKGNTKCVPAPGDTLIFAVTTGNIMCIEPRRVKYSTKQL